jgi:hypothetical protein
MLVSYVFTQTSKHSFVAVSLGDTLLIHNTRSADSVYMDSTAVAVLVTTQNCVQCNKQCSSDKQLAGCCGMHQGTCKKKTDLVRTPMCPVKQDYEQGLLSPSAGYGLYDFTSVFRASPHVLDFRCH